MLGIWWQETEGAKFWLAVLNDLHQRGVEDVLIGLRRRPDRASPRRSRRSSPRPGCRPASSIRSATACASSPTRTASASPPTSSPSTGPSTPTPPQAALAAFDEQVGRSKYPMIADSWRERWENIIPFLALPADLRSAVYTTNSIENLNRQIRKSDQDPRALPRRTGRHQAHLPRHPAIRTQMAQGLQLDRRPPRPQDPLRRPTPRLTPHHVASGTYPWVRTADERGRPWRAARPPPAAAPPASDARHPPARAAPCAHPKLGRR